MPRCSQRVVSSARSIPAVRLQWNRSAVLHLAPTVSGFWQRRLWQRTAREVRCLVDAAAAFVVCGLRIGTKGPATVRLPFRLMSSDDTVGRFSLFDPLFDDG